MRRISATALSAALVTVSIGVLGTGSATAAPRAASPEHLGAAPARVSPVHRAQERAIPRLGSPTGSAPSSVGIQTALPLAGFGDLLADPAHGHVFVSGGGSTDGVTVLTTGGTVVSTLPNLPGASGMTMSDDGSTLYVALAADNAIAEIDTATLAVTTVPTGDSTCPTTVAVTAGDLWFGYGCGSGNGGIGSVEPDGTVHLGVVTGFYYAPLLAASPSLDGALVTGVGGLSPATVQEYGVTGGSTPTGTLAHSTAFDSGFSNLEDLAVTPDGQDVVVASGAPYHHQVFKTSDLTADGTYTTSNYPNAVAINADGRVAAGINGSPDIWLFQPGVSTATRTYALRDGSLAPGGLAFAGTDIYAVTATGTGAYHLHIVSTLPNATVTVKTDKTAYHYGATAHVTVKVPGAPADSRVSVYARLATGAGGLVRSGHPQAGVFTATLRVGWRTTFIATYSGDSTHAPTTSKGVTVKTHARVVSKVFGRYATSHHIALFHVGKDPRIGAGTAPNHAGECLYFVAQKPAGGRWKTVGRTDCVVMNSDSVAGAIFSGTHAVGERVRFRAEWHGDRANLAQNGHWMYVRFTR